MADIQSIAIISHETKHDPKPYVAYNVKGEPVVASPGFHHSRSADNSGHSYPLMDRSEAL